MLRRSRTDHSLCAGREPCPSRTLIQLHSSFAVIGATMMLHCDLVYAAPGTIFRLPFVDLGLVPEAASSLLLPRRIGMAKAAEYLLLGDAFDAEEALRLGLVNAIVPARELRGFAIERAGRLAAKPRAAIAATRRLMRGDGEDIQARIEEEACHSHALGRGPRRLRGVSWQGALNEAACGTAHKHGHFSGGANRTKTFHVKHFCPIGA